MVDFLGNVDGKRLVSIAWREFQQWLSRQSDDIQELGLLAQISAYEKYEASKEKPTSH